MITQHSETSSFRLCIMVDHHVAGGVRPFLTSKTAKSHARRASLAMSTKSLGYTAAISDVSAVGGEPPQHDMMDIRVCGFSGEELLRTKLPAASTLGQEVRKMVAEKLPSKPGARFLLYQGVSQLMLNKTLQEQGIVGQEATLTYTFCSTYLRAAWSFVQERQNQEHPLALEGLTHRRCHNQSLFAQSARDPANLDVW